MRILIVNESAVFREIVMRMLREARFAEHDFIEASSGVEALALITEESPGLVLCDWRMPGLSGIETLDSLRKQGSMVPFCFITPDSTSSMRTEADDSAAFGFLTRPFTPEAFERVLREVLNPESDSSPSRAIVRADSKTIDR